MSGAARKDLVKVELARLYEQTSANGRRSS
jgi:hypothetical protein